MSAALRLTFAEGLAGFDQGADPSAVRRMGETGDQSYISVLIDILRFPWLLDNETERVIYTSLAKLTGKTYADLEPAQMDWSWWVEWLADHSEIEPPQGYARWKGKLLTRLVDPRVGSFLHEGVKANIRLEEIVWGGVPRDGIPDLQNPPTLPASEADYLRPNDRVFGVSISGESRAYPLRIMNPHEMANDEVGGVHFALAY